MIAITLPDGSRREFDQPVSVADVATSIGPGLAKAALAGKVDGKLVDASHRIDHDAALEIVTDKHPDALDVLRHSTAHLLAQAVQRLYPGAQVTIGPVIDNGFYYDFAYERPFTPEDLPAIEAEMQKIVKEAAPVTRSVKSRDDATEVLPRPGRGIQGADHRVDPGERGALAVFAGRVHRPVSVGRMCLRPTSCARSS
jgi:threonyl-tRNA synthetase